MKIHLLGPAGSGTTTLGRLISESLGIPHFDSDDFFWLKADPPFLEKRLREQRIELLKNTLGNHDSWVLSGSMLNWGDFLRPELVLIIYKYVPKEIRLERLKRREAKRYGNRIEPGNDMYPLHLEFLEWAAGYETGGMEMRSKMSEEAWMHPAACKILRLETEIPMEEELKRVLELTLKISQNPHQ